MQQKGFFVNKKKSRFEEKVSEASKGGGRECKSEETWAEKKIRIEDGENEIV